MLLDHLPPDPLSVVDVGSGGGLPGLPLKMARPSLALALIEANRRKAAFLVQAVAQLGLTGVEVLPRRAEDVGRDPIHRERYDVAVARAVASLPVLVELCLPLVAVGGRMLAMKTPVAGEVDSARAAIERLGGRLETVAAAPSEARTRGQVVVVAKVAPTPAEFPRRPGVPGRRPLAG